MNTPPFANPHPHLCTHPDPTSRPARAPAPPPRRAGLACLGTGDDEAFEDLKNTLYTDDAVAGEAAGLAMGLLLCGSSSDKAQEMLVRFGRACARGGMGQRGTSRSTPQAGRRAGPLASTSCRRRGTAPMPLPP